jgi:hypothetical protein
MPNLEPIDGVDEPEESAVDRSFVVVAERLLLEPEVVRGLDAKPPSHDGEPPQAA